MNPAHDALGPVWPDRQPTEPLRKDKGQVLIVDDSEINTLITQQALEHHGYKAEVVRTGESALERLATEAFDLICLDVGLPGIDGHEVCRRIRRAHSTAHLPVLMISASFTDEENVVRGLEAGANDYVRIPFAHLEFLGRVDSLVRLKTAEDRLRAMALEDSLTHLGNRCLFFRELPREMARASRHESCLCLALLDIDHFRKLNDAAGHQSGDDVLCGAAALIRENIREEDRAFRWGGDEFAILLAGADIQQAHGVVDRIRTQVESTDFSLADKNLHTSVSIGLGQYDPARHAEADEFVADVDRALARAKESGRDRIVLTK